MNWKLGMKWKVLRNSNCKLTEVADQEDLSLPFLIRVCLSFVFCLSICVSVLRFQNSQQNLYQGQPGACYWSAALYKQLTKCTKSVQCTEAGLNGCITVPSKVRALQCHKMSPTIPDSCSIFRACFVFIFSVMFIFPCIMHANKTELMRNV